MAAYTFPSAPVLIEETGEFAIGATGVLRASEGGASVAVYDLNDSPLTNILVGAKGAHQAFKADISNGVLDFGSVLLPALSQEAQVAAMTAQATADQALADSATALTNSATLLARQVVAGTGLSGGGDLSADRTLSVSFGSTSTTAAAGNHDHSSNDTVLDIVKLTQAAYDALTPKVATTLYVIQG